MPLKKIHKKYNKKIQDISRAINWIWHSKLQYGRAKKNLLRTFWAPKAPTESGYILEKKKKGCRSLTKGSVKFDKEEFEMEVGWTVFEAFFKEHYGLPAHQLILCKTYCHKIGWLIGVLRLHHLYICVIWAPERNPGWLALALLLRSPKAPKGSLSCTLP